MNFQLQLLLWYKVHHYHHTTSVSSTSDIQQILPVDVVEVFYRLYIRNSPVVLVKPMFSDDFFLGCFPATAVAPPHTVANVRKFLCEVEQIGPDVDIDLFTKASNLSPNVNDKEIIQIFGSHAPELMPSDPMALVIKSPTFRARSLTLFGRMIAQKKPKKPAVT